MKNALVTGGAGFLGSAIVRDLVERGVQVRVLALENEPTDNLAGLDGVEVMHGNVLSVDDTLRAATGMDTVFHCAAIYKDYVADPSPMYQVNLRGTFNMLEAARRAGVERVIYTASIVAIGRPPEGRIGDAHTPYEAWDLNFHYGRSKHLSMLTALDFANWGLDVRVVCPGVVFGPGDVAPTPSGKIIIAVCNGKARAYSAGGLSYVDVRDAARVHVLSAERGRAGEVYIATGHNVENEAFLQTIQRAYDKPLPTPRKVPAFVAQTAVSGAAVVMKTLGKEPEMTRELMAFNSKPAYYSNAKARTELGATFRPLEETIHDAIAYFRSRGELP